jgi:hypothetical protein
MVLIKYGAPVRLGIFKVLKKNQGKFPQQILQYFLQAILRHSLEITPSLYFSHLSLSCLEDKQENLYIYIWGGGHNRYNSQLRRRSLPGMWVDAHV